MLLTFIDTGIRLSELIQLNLSDLNLRDSSLRIEHGKGDKERHVFMGRKLNRAMRMWINARGITIAQDALFISKNGERLEKRNIQRILHRLADKAGLKDVKVSPHRLRHTFAVEYIRNGGDPFSLQRILGHSSISTTTIYVHLAGAGLREAHAKASPVDRL
jgi:integrase/recombinase XerD